MEIKVLGTGCASCKALYATVEQVVKELALEAVIRGAHYAYLYYKRHFVGHDGRICLGQNEVGTLFE